MAFHRTSNQQYASLLPRDEQEAARIAQAGWFERRYDAWVKPLFRHEFWLREVLHILASISVVCVLAGVVHMYDGRPVAAWNANFTLNAFISVLVTALYMLLAANISNCVSQLKWLHFHHPRSLYDMQTCDGMSRSGLLQFDSYKLVFRRGTSWLLRFAFFLTTLTVLVGPFSQQILQFEDQEFPDSGRALIPTAQNISSSAMDQGNPRLAIAASISSAFFASSASQFSVNPVCSNGNCTWDKYATLSVQRSCQVKTKDLKFAEPHEISGYFDGDHSKHEKMLPFASINNRTDVSLEDFYSSFTDNFVRNYDKYAVGHNRYSMGYSLASVTARHTLHKNMSLPKLNTTRLVPVQRGIMKQTFDVIFLDGNITGHIFSNDTKRNFSTSRTSGTAVNINRKGAWECELEFVLQPMTGAFMNGHFVENTTGPSVRFDDSGPDATVEDCYASPSCGWLKFRDRDQQYTMSRDFPYKLFNPMRRMLEGMSFRALDMDVSLAENYNPQAWSQGKDLAHFVAAIETGALEDDPNAAPAPAAGVNKDDKAESSARPIKQHEEYDDGSGYMDTPKTMDELAGHLAQTLTKFMRNYHSTLVPGRVTVVQTAYSVEWEWISIPIALIVGTAVLVALTARETRKKDLPTWTNSVPALLVHPLNDVIKRSIKGTLTYERLEEESKRVQVRLSDQSLRPIQTGEAEKTST